MRIKRKPPEKMVPAKLVGAWLRGTKAGQEILRQEVDGEVARLCGSCKRAGRVPVLVLMDSDGGIEVYASRHVMVHIEHTVKDADIEVCEEYLKQSMPRWASEIYFPVFMRTQDCPQERTIEKDRRAAMQNNLIAELLKFSREWGGVPMTHKADPF